MYKSSLRHIHDPVLSSLKMDSIRFFSSNFNQWNGEVIKLGVGMISKLQNYLT
jgi:hypothetical protein